MVCCMTSASAVFTLTPSSSSSAAELAPGLLFQNGLMQKADATGRQDIPRWEENYTDCQSQHERSAFCAELVWTRQLCQGLEGFKALQVFRRHFIAWDSCNINREAQLNEYVWVWDSTRSFSSREHDEFHSVSLCEAVCSGFCFSLETGAERAHQCKTIPAYQCHRLWNMFSSESSKSMLKKAFPGKSW